MRSLASGASLAILLALALAAPAVAVHPNPVSVCATACVRVATTSQGSGTCEAGAPYHEERNSVVATVPGVGSVDVYTVCFAHSYLGPQTSGATYSARATAPMATVTTEWSGYSGASSACHARAGVDSTLDASTGTLACPAGRPPAPPPVLLLIP